MHKDAVTGAALRLAVAEQEADDARAALKEVIAEATTDAVPLAAIERWTGLSRTQVRTLNP